MTKTARVQKLRLVGYGVLFLAAAVGLACGKSSSMSPSPSGGGGGGGPTITITSSGVNPRMLTVSRGAQVTFVNNDTRSHQMNSDPHPTHGDCPEIDAVGFLGPGQSRQTGNLNTVRTCGYHDHNDFANASLQGTITIQ